MYRAHHAYLVCPHLGFTIETLANIGLGSYYYAVTKYADLASLAVIVW